MIVTGKKFSKPEMSRVINGDKILPIEAEKPEKIRLDVLRRKFTRVISGRLCKSLLNMVL